MGPALDQSDVPDEPDAAESAAETSDSEQNAGADGSNLLEERGQGAGRLLGAGAEQAFTGDEGQEGRGSAADDGSTE